MVQELNCIKINGLRWSWNLMEDPIIAYCGSTIGLFKNSNSITDFMIQTPYLSEFCPNNTVRVRVLCNQHMKIADALLPQAFHSLSISPQNLKLTSEKMFVMLKEILTRRSRDPQVKDVSMDSISGSSSDEEFTEIIDDEYASTLSGSKSDAMKKITTQMFASSPTSERQSRHQRSSSVAITKGEMQNLPAIESQQNLLTKLWNRFSSFIPPAMPQFTIIEKETCNVFESDCTHIILHIHGGGFISQTTQSHKEYLTKLTRQKRNFNLANVSNSWANQVTGNVIVFSVEYSLSPEQVFPTAVEECFGFYKWILSPENRSKFDLQPGIYLLML
jgi:hypothetical protein